MSFKNLWDATTLCTFYSNIRHLVFYTHTHRQEEGYMARSWSWKLLCANSLSLHMIQLEPAWLYTRWDVHQHRGGSGIGHMTASNIWTAGGRDTAIAFTIFTIHMYNKIAHTVIVSPPFICYFVLHARPVKVINHTNCTRPLNYAKTLYPLHCWLLTVSCMCHRGLGNLQAKFKSIWFVSPFYFPFSTNSREKWVESSSYLCNSFFQAHSCERLVPP